MKTILQLIREECANHDNEMNNIKNHCCISGFSGYQCTYFKDENFRCPYFEQSVLPLDKQLEAVYHAKSKAKVEGREISSQEIISIRQENSIVIKCKKCKEEFRPLKDKQQYCNECKKEIRKNKIRVSKKRSG